MAPDNDGFQVTPFYIVCDESQSMEGPKLDACNKALPEIHKAIATDPIIYDMVWIGIISFSDTAEVLLPLSKMTDVVDFPGLVVKDGRNYGNVFNLLRSVISADIESLQSTNHRVMRPLVFFISNGEPTDTNWQVQHQEVADKTWPFSPHIISFGVGGAQAQTIKDVATKVDKHNRSFAYLADDNADPGAVLKEIFKSLLGTIVGTARNPDAGGMILPTQGPGFIKLDEV